METSIVDTPTLKTENDLQESESIEEKILPDLFEEQNEIQLPYTVKKFKCEGCNKKFYKTLLDSHVCKNDGKREEFICGLCSKPFSEQWFLTGHYRYHSKEELETIGIIHFCSFCDLGYSTEEERDRHAKSHRSDVKVSCELCGKAFNGPYHLRRHIMDHTGENKFPCAECGKTFNRRHLLTKHLASHLGIAVKRERKCHICGKIYQSPGGLSNHIQQKHTDLNFPCEICGKVFQSKNHCKQHMMTHTGEKKHTCEFCGKAFSHKSGLTTHCLTHTGKSKEKPFICEACGKKFRYESEIINHYKIHAGEQPHKCVHCGKGFTSNYFLKVHIKAHCKVLSKDSTQQTSNPYNCEICSMTFKNQNRLSSHLIQHRKSGVNVKKGAANNSFANISTINLPVLGLNNTSVPIIIQSSNLISPGANTAETSPAKLRPLRPKIPVPIIPANSNGMIVFQYKNNDSVSKSSKNRPIAPAILPMMTEKNIVNVSFAPNIAIQNQPNL